MATDHLFYVPKDGPGLKVLDRKQQWYGGGYCGICGCRDTPPLVPRAVRWWDCDDGWKMGVLCQGCAEEARERGPQADDYAVATEKEDELSSAERIDIEVGLGDLDGAYAQGMD